MREGLVLLVSGRVSGLTDGFFCAILNDMNLEDVQKRLHDERDHLESVVADLLSLLGKNPAGTSGLQSVPETITRREYFKIFREYRLAEQNLLNHRLTWNLALQGFLFATYGLSLEKMAGLQAEENGAKIHKVASDVMSHLQLLLKAIPLVGVSLSVCILTAVIGSWLALKNLDQGWRDNIDDKRPPYVPSPKGGGSNAALLLGFVPPVFIPLIFAVAWVWIILRR